MALYFMHAIFGKGQRPMSINMLFDVPGWNLAAPATAAKKDSKPAKSAATPAEPAAKAPPGLLQGKGGKGEKSARTLVTEKQTLPLALARAPRAAVHKHTATAPVPAAPAGAGTRPVALNRHEEKLKGARFRFLNQRLYESHSSEALAYFREHPQDFAHYHEGFRAQVSHWPVNPVDLFIGALRERLQTHAQKTPLVVADMGCGEAKIMRAFAGDARIAVHSFDLAAAAEGVVVCDMSHVPLPQHSVDAVIFSLSLMNTNYTEALVEAGRLLRPRTGTLHVAEVESRFEGGDPAVFVRAVEALGFRTVTVDRSHRVFVLLHFQAMTGRAGTDRMDRAGTDKAATDKVDRAGNTAKAAKAPKAAKTDRPHAPSQPVLKPCLYKKR